MVTSSQLGNLVVTYTLYLMKRTGRNSSQRFINGSNSAKERPGESKKKKKEQKIFDRPVFRSDRSINLEEEERACYRSIASPNQAKFAKEESVVYPFRRELHEFTFILFLLVEIPRVVQTQGTAGEESGEHEDDDDDRGYDGRAGE